MKTYKNDTDKTAKLKYCMAPGHGGLAHVHQWRHLDIPTGSRLSYDDAQLNGGSIATECSSQSMVEVTA